LFDAKQVLDELRTRGVKMGVASSVLVAQWAASEIYARASNPLLAFRPEQTELLLVFAPT
jgi:hypothetical protein